MANQKVIRIKNVRTKHKGFWHKRITNKASQKWVKWQQNTESKRERELHSLLSASFYLPEETLLATDRSASCHLMLSDSFKSQSTVKGGGLRDWQGESKQERERKKTGTPTRTFTDVTRIIAQRDWTGSHKSVDTRRSTRFPYLREPRLR